MESLRVFARYHACAAADECHIPPGLADGVLEPESSQEETWELCARPLVEACLEHRRGGTLITYGAWGSGKSHTLGCLDVGQLSPSSLDAGILTRAITHLFHVLGPGAVVRLVCMEMVGDEVCDLLAPRTSPRPSKPAPVGMGSTEKDSKPATPPNGPATAVEANSVHQALSILRPAILRRLVAKLEGRHGSSVSHAVFQLSWRTSPSSEHASPGGGPFSPSSASTRRSYSFGVSSPPQGGANSRPGELSPSYLPTVGWATLNLVDLSAPAVPLLPPKAAAAMRRGLLSLGKALGLIWGGEASMGLRESRLTRALQGSVDRVVLLCCLNGPMMVVPPQGHVVAAGGPAAAAAAAAAALSDDATLHLMAQLNYSKTQHLGSGKHATSPLSLRRSVAGAGYGSAGSPGATMAQRELQYAHTFPAHHASGASATATSLPASAAAAAAAALAATAAAAANGFHSSALADEEQEGPEDHPSAPSRLLRARVGEGHALAVSLSRIPHYQGPGGPQAFPLSPSWQQAPQSPGPMSAGSQQAALSPHISLASHGTAPNQQGPHAPDALSIGQVGGTAEGHLLRESAAGESTAGSVISHRMRDDKHAWSPSADAGDLTPATHSSASNSLSSTDFFAATGRPGLPSASSNGPSQQPRNFAGLPAAAAGAQTSHTAAAAAAPASPPPAAGAANGLRPRLVPGSPETLAGPAHIASAFGAPVVQPAQNQHGHGQGQGGSDGGVVAAGLDHDGGQSSIGLRRRSRSAQPTAGRRHLEAQYEKLLDDFKSFMVQGQQSHGGRRRSGGGLGQPLGGSAGGGAPASSPAPPGLGRQPSLSAGGALLGKPPLPRQPSASSSTAGAAAAAAAAVAAGAKANSQAAGARGAQGSLAHAHSSRLELDSGPRSSSAPAKALRGATPTGRVTGAGAAAAGADGRGVGSRGGAAVAAGASNGLAAVRERRTGSSAGAASPSRILEERLQPSSSLFRTPSRERISSGGPPRVSSAGKGAGSPAGVVLGPIVSCSEAEAQDEEDEEDLFGGPPGPPGRMSSGAMLTPGLGLGVVATLLTHASPPRGRSSLEVLHFHASPGAAMQQASPAAAAAAHASATKVAGLNRRTLSPALEKPAARKASPAYAAKPLQQQQQAGQVPLSRRLSGSGGAGVTGYMAPIHHNAPGSASKATPTGKVPAGAGTPGSATAGSAARNVSKMPHTPARPGSQVPAVVPGTAPGRLQQAQQARAGLTTPAGSASKAGAAARGAAARLPSSAATTPAHAGTTGTAAARARAAITSGGLLPHAAGAASPAVPARARGVAFTTPPRMPPPSSSVHTPASVPLTPAAARRAATIAAAAAARQAVAAARTRTTRSTASTAGAGPGAGGAGAAASTSSRQTASRGVTGSGGGAGPAGSAIVKLGPLAHHTSRAQALAALQATQLAHRRHGYGLSTASPSSSMAAANGSGLAGAAAGLAALASAGKAAGTGGAVHHHYAGGPAVVAGKPSWVASSPTIRTVRTRAPAHGANSASQTLPPRSHRGGSGANTPPLRSSYHVDTPTHSRKPSCGSGSQQLQGVSVLLDPTATAQALDNSDEHSASLIAAVPPDAMLLPLPKGLRGSPGRGQVQGQSRSVGPGAQGAAHATPYTLSARSHEVDEKPSLELYTLPSDVTRPDGKSGPPSSTDLLVVQGLRSGSATSGQPAVGLVLAEEEEDSDDGLGGGRGRHAGMAMPGPPRSLFSAVGTAGSPQEAGGEPTLKSSPPLGRTNSKSAGGAGGAGTTVGRAGSGLMQHRSTSLGARSPGASGQHAQQQPQEGQQGSPQTLVPGGQVATLQEDGLQGGTAAVGGAAGVAGAGAGGSTSPGATAPGLLRNLAATCQEDLPLVALSQKLAASMSGLPTGAWAAAAAGAGVTNNSTSTDRVSPTLLRGPSPFGLNLSPMRGFASPIRGLPVPRVTSRPKLSPPHTQDESTRSPGLGFPKSDGTSTSGVAQGRKPSLSAGGAGLGAAAGTAAPTSDVMPGDASWGVAETAGSEELKGKLSAPPVLSACTSPPRERLQQQHHHHRHAVEEDEVVVGMWASGEELEPGSPKAFPVHMEAEFVESSPEKDSPHHNHHNHHGRHSPRGSAHAAGPQQQQQPHPQVGQSLEAGDAPLVQTSTWVVPVQAAAAAAAAQPAAPLPPPPPPVRTPPLVQAAFHGDLLVVESPRMPTGCMNGLKKHGQPGPSSSSSSKQASGAGGSSNTNKPAAGTSKWQSAGQGQGAAQKLSPSKGTGQHPEKKGIGRSGAPPAPTAQPAKKPGGGSNPVITLFRTITRRRNSRASSNSGSETEHYRS